MYGVDQLSLLCDVLSTFCIQELTVYVCVIRCTRNRYVGVYICCATVYAVMAPRVGYSLVSPYMSMVIQVRRLYGVPLGAFHAVVFYARVMNHGTEFAVCPIVSL